MDEAIRIKEGKIFKSQVTGITKSQRNSPGEKNASYDASLIYGTINKNNYNGIYGMYNAYFDEGNLIEASSELITPGIAYIRTTINGDLIKEYAIEILKVYPLNETRNILFKVTDKNLLDEAGGIVQGMSGSPIIQNDNIIRSYDPNTGKCLKTYGDFGFSSIAIYEATTRNKI